MNSEELSRLAPLLGAMAVLVLLSAFFSGSETSLFSLTRGQRERLARSPRSVDRYVANLLSDPRRLIATVLLGNELINITFSSLAASVIERVTGDHVGVVAVTFLTTALTVPLLLLLGEITPKSIALAVPESWARVAAYPLGAFMVVVTPVRVIVAGVAALFVRVLGQKADPDAHKLGEAEFKALVDVGSEAGELEAAERRLIHNVFEFADRAVVEIMTPARDVFSLSFELPLARVVSEVAKSGFSRVPVHRGKQKDKQEIVGVLFAKDLVGWSSGRLSAKTIKDLVRPVSYVPKTSKCAQVFQEFQRHKTHFAIVVDEYGRQVGLVTMEDLLVELFGQLGQEPRGNAPRHAADAPSAPVRLPMPPPPSEAGDEGGGGAS
jgi:putative hemolysin